MIHPPKLKYNGLTVILSQPSRFDLKQGRLLTGAAGYFFKDVCLRPLYPDSCEFRTSDEVMPIREGTQCLFLLGERAFKEHARSDFTQDYSLDVQRGCPLISTHNNIPAIASYLPQDAFDPVDYESTHNPLLANANVSRQTPEFQTHSSESGEDESEDEGSIKDHGRTRRSNYRFWLERDSGRVKHILQSGVPTVPTPTYRIYPEAQEVISFLKSIRDTTLFLDIECDIEYQNLWCIGIGTSLDVPIYVIPVFRFDGSYAYSNLLHIISWIVYAMSVNTVVIHNSKFDLFVLANRYGLPFGRKNYDTMIAHHKCFVGAEKSLGHAMSHLTWLPYHKDEGIFFPTNPHQEQKLWKYNGKDIFGMMLVYYELERMASLDPGLRSSIDCTNNCIYPYMLNTLTGIHYDKNLLLEIVGENDRKMEQLVRIIKILLGGNMVLPTSNKQCVEYFHDVMNYPVMGRSDKTRRPSLGEKYLYKLKLKLHSIGIENPMIDICIKYRQIQKETGMLGFTPWKE